VGVAGVAGFACAKLAALKAELVKAITATSIMLFTVSTAFLSIRRDIFKSARGKYLALIFDFRSRRFFF